MSTGAPTVEPSGRRGQTRAVDPASPAGRAAGRRRAGRRLAIVALAAVAWSTARAGFGDGVLNLDGLPAFARFWAAVVRPAVGLEFLRLTADAAVVTLAYAVLGLALSILLGMVGALGLSKLVRPRRRVRAVTGAMLAVPRGVHEILWALFLVQILGFDPLVPVLAIALPYGAITAKVFAEAIDEADPGPYHQLRATGARPLTALLYGVIPNVRGELLSYLFYRFECGIRSAAVLGVVGAGGLGFQLDLSFETLRYHEIWTLIAALMILSGGVEAWSSVLRRELRAAERPSTAPDHTAADRTAADRTGTTGATAVTGTVGRRTAVAAVALVPLAWWWVGLDLRPLFEARTRTLAIDLVADLLSPRLGPGGWGELVDATIDTVAMSILALVVAVVAGLALGSLAAAPDRTVTPGPVRRFVRWPARLVLLLARAVPAPVWAFLMVLVLFPGLWPGAVALGIYTLGVLGRLFAETLEDRDPGPTRALAVTGASPTTAFFYGSLPAASPRLIALGLYRWEVITRETVVVGVVGAGGLGQLINSHLAARDLRAVLSAVIALIVIAVVIDRLSDLVRSRLRGPAPADRADEARSLRRAAA